MTEIDELSIDPEHERDDEARDDQARDAEHHNPRYLKHRRKRILRDTLLVLMAIALFAILLVGAYFAVSAIIVARETKAAAASVSDVRDLDFTKDGAAAKLGDAVDALQGHADAAYARTSGPIWGMMTHLPYYGGDVQAVRSAVDALHTIADDALPLVVDAVSDVDPSAISVADGKISVPGLSTAAPKLAKANGYVLKANSEFQSVDGVTSDALRSQLEPARKSFLSFTKMSDELARGAQVLSGMLGGSGTDSGDGVSRNYLILAQNNAEIRATGGISGSLGLVTVHDGAITMHDFVSASGFGERDEPVIPLTDDEKQLYGDRLGEFMQDVNFTPDFARVGELAAAMWKDKYGDQVDGVIAVDPVFLQRLLAVAGPVDVTHGGHKVTLDGTHTASILLSDVYRYLPDNDEQDAFFAGAAQAAFGKVLYASGANSVALAKQTIAAANDGHLHVWSADESEQKLLAGTTVGGTLVTKDSGSYLSMSGAAPRQVIGVYYNDAMASKMDWYLRRDVKDKLVKTYENGSEEHQITITMTNTLDGSQVNSLPSYVIGSLENGAEKGHIQFITYLYAPAGGGIPSYTAGSDKAKGDVYALHDGLTVIGKQISLAPGESTTITATVVTAPGSAAGQTVVRQTPLVK